MWIIIRHFAVSPIPKCTFIFFLRTRFRSSLLLCLLFLSFLIFFFSPYLHLLNNFIIVPPSDSISPCLLSSCLVSLLLPTTSMQAGFCSSLAKIHNQWWWLFGTIMFCSRKLALSNGVIVHPLSVVISVEINRRNYFWNSLICYNCFRLYSSCLHTEPLNFFLMYINSATAYHWRTVSLAFQLLTHISVYSCKDFNTCLSATFIYLLFYLVSYQTIYSYLKWSSRTLDILFPFNFR
jgi:hypothetical protein